MIIIQYFISEPLGFALPRVIMDGDIISVFCESAANGRTDSAGAARDDGGFHFYCSYLY